MCVLSVSDLRRCSRLLLLAYVPFSGFTVFLSVILFYSSLNGISRGVKKVVHWGSRLLLGNVPKQSNDRRGVGRLPYLHAFQLIQDGTETVHLRFAVGKLLTTNRSLPVGTF